MTPALERLRSARHPGWLFTGGSARCAFQIGVIEELLALGLRPAACLGVSGGAWNAAAVATGQAGRLRGYWRFFTRMPYFDASNLWREHSPFIWPRIHRRAFDRYLGDQAIAAAPIPLFIAVTRLRDGLQMIVDARAAADPFRLLLASNHLPPFYTHAPELDGERCTDGGFTNNVPYEYLLDHGCDVVVIVTSKGESEGGLYRNADDFDHEIPPALRDRVIVIRPRHRMALRFVERRWVKLAEAAQLGALRAREVLLGERHPETDSTSGGTALTLQMARARRWWKGLIHEKNRNRRPASGSSLPDGSTVQPCD